MSVSLKEVLEDAGYSFSRWSDDCYRIMNLLNEADDLKEEVEDLIDAHEDAMEDLRQDSYNE